MKRLFTVLTLSILANVVHAEDPLHETFAQMIEQRYAAPFRAGQLDKWLEVFDDHAVALHNRRPADQGKAAIRKFGELVFSTFRAAKFSVTLTEARRNHDTVITHGTYASHLIFKETGESAPWGPEQGKFLFIWERQSDGGWLITVDMGNASQ